MLTVGGMFLLSAVMNHIAGTRLSHYADQIAGHSGLGRLWIGVVVLAGATCLSEVFTAVNDVLIDAPNIADGDLFGSNAFNMAILLMADLAYGKGPLLAAVDPTHAITAFVSISLMSVGMMGIVYRAEKRFMLIEPDSVLMIVGYGLGMRFTASTGGDGYEI
ncbi:MAG: hypothetical protein Q7U39_01190 [Nitrospira sp.]|nr:hypothetical protein [Nitrospira sp.]